MNGPAAAASGPDARTAERKLLTLLFVDLSGYTRLTTTRDPEDVLLAVGPLLADLRNVAEEHGGHVPSVQGDGFMSVFGVPVAHTDDTRRAVDAAEAMRSVVAARRQEAPDVPDVHIGIASGEVLVTPQPDGHDVIGPAVNLAARLSDAAAPGEVLVDEPSVGLTSGYGVYGPARLLTLNGFAAGIRASPLQAVSPAHSEGALPLVGRGDVLAALDRALEGVVSTGASAVILVVGEPGAGKTHLVSSWSTGRDGIVLRGSCRPYGSALPLSALSEAILGADLGADGQAVTAEYDRLLPPRRVGSAMAREPDEALHVAARRWLEEVGRERPTVLVLEDLHWADDALVDLLRAVQETPLRGRVLVVGTTREALDHLPQAVLPRLTPEEIAEVAGQRLGARPDPALVQLLVERSGGNALWLVECLGLLSDRGQLSVEADVVRMRDLGHEIEVPASIRMLVSARLDSLVPEQKRTLQRASVRPGDIAPADWPGTAEQVDEFVALGLLDRAPSGAVRFAHGLIRESVYRSMPRAARVREHEHLLETSADPATRSYAALEVQRLDVAPDEARRTLVAAQALDAVTAHARHLRTSHTRAARDVLLRAEELCREVDVVAPRAAAAFLTELAEVQRDLEDRERARGAAERAAAVAELAGDPDVLTRAQLALGEVSLGIDNRSARRVAELALAREPMSPDLRGRAWQLLAGSHAYDDMAQLQQCLERAFTSYVAAGDAAASAEAARRLAFNLSMTADARFDHWLDVAASSTAADHLRGQGELALVRAVVAQARGSWEESWQAAESAMELIERAGMHQWLVDATAVAVEAATATSRSAVLPDLIARLTTLMEGRRARLQITGLCASAPALMLLGQAEQARQALRSARGLLSSVGRNEEVMVLAAEGHTAALAGDHPSAAAAYNHAETLAAELGFSLASLAYRLHRLAAQAVQGERPGLHAELLALASDLDVAGAASHASKARTIAGRLAERAGP